MRKTKYFDCLDKALKKPKKVENLTLSNQMLQNFPAEIFSFKNLRSLNLSYNPIKKIPALIKMLDNLEELNVHNCWIIELPEEICLLKKLKKLTISNNFIKGFPSGMENLSNLKILVIGCDNEGCWELIYKPKIFEEIFSSEIERFKKLIPECKIIHNSF